MRVRIGIPKIRSDNRRERTAPIQHRAHSAAVPCTIKLRVIRPCARAVDTARDSAAGEDRSATISRKRSSTGGEVRPKKVVTCPPASPMRAARSVNSIACGKSAATCGNRAPISPLRPPYIIASMPTFAWERSVKPTPFMRASSAIPAYRSAPRPAEASASSRLNAARMRGSICEPSVTVST